MNRLIVGFLLGLLVTGFGVSTGLLFTGWVSSDAGTTANNLYGTLL